MKLLFTLVFVSFLSASAFAQTSATTNRCFNPQESCVTEGELGCNKKLVPVLTGTPYLVPKLKFTLIDTNTNKPAAGAKMRVHYNFKWLEYPYPEHPFGAWSGGGYSTDTCIADGDGVIEADQFKVEPHGYYKGFYSNGHKPAFTSVSVSYYLRKVGSSDGYCVTSSEISKSQLDKCRDKGLCEYTLKKGCPTDWR